MKFFRVFLVGFSQDMNHTRRLPFLPKNPLLLWRGGTNKKALTLHVAIEMRFFLEWMPNFLISRGRYLFRQDQTSTTKVNERPLFYWVLKHGTPGHLANTRREKTSWKTGEIVSWKLFRYPQKFVTCQKGEVLVMNLQLQDLNSYDVTISKQLGILLKRPLDTQGVQPPCHISFLSEESNKVGFFLSCNDLFASTLHSVFGKVWEVFVHCLIFVLICLDDWRE